MLPTDVLITYQILSVGRGEELFPSCTENLVCPIQSRR